MLFFWTEKYVSANWDEGLLEKYMRQYGRKWFPLVRKSPARISSVFKNWFPLVAVTVSTSRKKLSSKVTVFIREKYPSPMAGMKDSFKNTFPLDRKKAFSGRCL